MHLVHWLRGFKAGISHVVKSMAPKKRARRLGATNSIEGLEDRTLLSYDAVFDTGVLTLTDNAGDDDVLTLSLSADGLYLAHGVNEAGLGADPTDFGGNTYLISGLTQIVVNGGDGNDRLIIDFSAGNWIPLLGGLSFDGGLDGDDTLETTGGTFTNGAITASGVGAGTIQYDALGTITFAGLEPIVDDNIVTNFTITGTAGADNITIANNGDAMRTRVSEAANNFESVAFMNKTNVTVNALGGADTITLANNSAPAVGLARLVVNGDATENGATQAGDVITINNAFTLPAGTLSLTAPTITQTAGAVTLTTLNLYGGVNQTGGNVVVTGTTTAAGGATGNISLNQVTNNFGTVTVTSGVNVTLVDANDITLGPITATGALSVTATGAITQNGAVSSIASLNYDAGTTITINTATITSTGNQTYNDPVILTANTVLSTTNNGDITFGGTVNGAYTLAVNTGGNTIFNGAVGGNAALVSLTTDANGAGVTRINGGAVNTTGNQTYNDPVVLGTNTVLTSTANGDITFGGTLNGAYTLAVNTAGNSIFNGAVGGNAALISLTTDANGAGVTRINGGAVNTTGSQTYNDPVVLGANTVLTSTTNGVITFGGTVNGAYTLAVNTAGNTIFNGAVGGNAALVSLTTDANGAGGTHINGGAVNTTGNQTYNDSVVLGANTILTSTTNGDITFGGTLNGAYTLAVNTAGNSVFNGAVGGNAALVSLTTDANGAGVTQINGGSVRTTGNQTYNDPVVLGANTILTSTTNGDITFGGTLNGAYTLAVNTAGNTVFNGAVGGAVPLTSLTTDADGAGQTRINGGSIRTSGNQTYNDAVVLGANATLTSTAAGDIQFASTLNGAYSLAVNTAGDTIFSAAVGGNAALTSLTTDAPGPGVTRINGGAVNTTGNQTYNDPVVLGANTILTSTANGDITFGGTLNGAYTLAVNTAGNSIFNGAVGGNAALVSLTTDANGAGVTQINGGAVNTTGNQTYNDPVVLGANTVLTSTTNGDITFGGTLNGAYTLAVNTAGNTIFNGAVGGNAALVSLTTDANGAGVTQINGGAVNTTGNQTYNDPVVLGANTVLTSTTNGDITFGGTLNGAYTLAVNTAGNSIFNGAVGGNAALVSLTTDANGAGVTQINGGSVRTTGNQTYNDPVVLGANTILTSTTNGDITFGGTLNGAYTLAVNTAGNTVFNGAVGGAVPLTSLTTDADGAGQTRINGGSIRTSGNQTYNDAVVLGANATLTSTAAGDIQFASTLNGAYSLAVNTAGDTIFSAAVGGNAALTSLTTDAPGPGVTRINGGAVNTTGNQTYNDPVVLGANTILTSTANGDITFGGTLNGAYTLAVNTAGNSIFNGAVGGNAALVSLTTDANGAGVTQINGGAVNTTGNQTYNDPVVLGANTVLTSTTNGDITFGGTLNGAYTLAVNTAGNTIFNGAVGGNAALVSLTTDANGAGVTQINGGSIKTTSHQTYGDDVHLGASAVLTSTSTGDIKFLGKINGTFDLTINTAGETVFGDGGADYIGNTERLQSLTTDAPGLTRFDISSSSDGTPSVWTVDNQLFNDRVLLKQDTFLRSEATSGDLTFASTVDSNDATLRALTLIAGNEGTITFKDEVGSAHPLGSAAGAALSIKRGAEALFEQTVSEVRLSGPLLIASLVGTTETKILVHGEKNGATNYTTIVGVRDSQNVIEITTSGTSSAPNDQLRLQDLNITRDGTPAAGNGVAVESNPSGTTLSQITMDGLLVYANAENGIKMTGVSNFTLTDNIIRSNFYNGVLLTNASNSSIEGNQIFNNGNSLPGAQTAAGIRIVNAASTRNSILSNSIYDNGPLNRGVGIDLVGGDELATGMTLNDKDLNNLDLGTNNSDNDAGPNDLQNFPEISFVYVANAALNITYSVPTMQSAAYGIDQKLRIQFFVSNDLVNPSNARDDWREGRTYLIDNDAYYNYSDRGRMVTATIPIGDLPVNLQAYFQSPNVLTTAPIRIVATATGDGNTSEFSRAAAINAMPGTNPAPQPVSQANPIATTDPLGARGYIFAPGPKTPVSGEVPAFELHWATDGDNNQDINNGNPATYFNDELGIFSIDDSTGRINGIAGGINEVSYTAYIEAVGQQVANWLATNGKLSGSNTVDSGVIRNSITGYLTTTDLTSSATSATFRFITPLSKTELETILNGPGAVGGLEGYAKTVLLLSQEEVKLDSVVVKIADKWAQIDGPNGITYNQFDVEAEITRSFNNTTAESHKGGTPVEPTDTNKFGVPTDGYVLMVRGTSEVSAVDNDGTNLNQIAFYLVQNGSFAELLQQNPSNLPLNPAVPAANPFVDAPQVFFSLQGSNQDSQYHFRTLLTDGFLKFYWSDAYNNGFYGKPVGQSTNTSPRGIKDAVVTVVDPFVQPLFGDGSRSALAGATSVEYPMPGSNNILGPTAPAPQNLGLSIGTATWVDGVGVATGTVSRTDTTEEVTITLAHNNNTTIKVGDQTFGPGTPATITLHAGQASATFTVTNITKSSTVTGSADGFTTKTKTVAPPKGKAPKPKIDRDAAKAAAKAARDAAKAERDAAKAARLEARKNK